MVDEPEMLVAEARAGITVEVGGWPPNKNEPTSLLARGHPEAGRVRALLEAARSAAQRVAWTPLAGDIALGLVVRGPARPPSDATNYLGGVGDALQDKTNRPNIDLAHLGELAGVALYANDRQITQIHYGQHQAAEPSYTIRIRQLGSPALATFTAGEERASERGRKVATALAAKGAELGFTVQYEYPVPGGRLDLVWLMPELEALPGSIQAPPVVGFEIESSWRTRKHLKGDYLNLHDLGAILGVLVLLGEGSDVDATRRFAQALVDRPGPRVLIWSEQDVAQLVGAPTSSPTTSSPTGDEAGSSNPSNAVRHVGKFRALWAWLRDQSVHELALTFDEIEEVVGIPLPPSCRKHAAHWYSHEGSAIARAIQDAGWAATRVNLREQHLVLVRREHASQL